MLVSKSFLLFGAVASTATLENVVCNGKDQISMVLTADQVAAGAIWQVTGCPAGHTSNLDASAISQNGNVYTIAFNPYTACNTTPNPSQASTYSVDITLTAQTGVTVAGQTVHFTGTSMDLKCTFQDTYSLTSDLGGVNLEGDQLAGEDFALTVSMTRTQSDYTTAETGTVVANSMVYHTIVPSAQISGLSGDWRIVPNKITLRKGAAGGTEFDIFKHDMGSCGYSQIDWAVQFDQTTQVYNFAFRAMVLDAPDSSNYMLTVEVGLCNLASTSSECTGMLTQCSLLMTGPHAPCTGGGTWDPATVSNQFTISGHRLDRANPDTMGQGGRPRGATLCNWHSYYELRLIDCMQYANDCDVLVGYSSAPYDWQTTDHTGYSTDHDYFGYHGWAGRPLRRRLGSSGGFGTSAIRYLDNNVTGQLKVKENDVLGVGIHDDKQEILFTINGNIVFRDTFANQGITDSSIYKPMIWLWQQGMAAEYVESGSLMWDPATWP